MHDAIVIGSGIGGLTAAGLLAGVAGRRVLVLEKHTEPGGFTQVFRRDGAQWDVGLHYVGQVEPASPTRAFFDYLSGGELRWNRMPDDFERFVYPGLDFVVPSDPRRYGQRLAERFPDEAAAIHRYFRDIRAVARWSILGFMRGMVPQPVVPILGLIQRVGAARATQTTQHYLERHFRSPQLRALLASQWGDYGLPPSRSAFAIHAQIVAHFLHGAWYPEGGASRIARTFERGIESAGGAVIVGQEVTRIVVEDGRAAGVVAVDRRGPGPREVVYRAPFVISNVGAAATFQRLLPTDGPTGAKTEAVRRLIGQLGRGLSAATLYLRLKASAETIGVRGENVWVNVDLAHDDLEGQSRGLFAGRPRRIYVSFPSIKGADDRFHTAEIIAFVEPNGFSAWRAMPKGNRGGDYSELKQRIGDGMLRLADSAIPGLANLVQYAELSTPLSVEHYTSHDSGALYGLPATPDRHRSPLLGPRTPIEGVVLSGTDAGCLGIVGALMGGVGAACQVLGFRGYPMIQAALKKGPPSRASTPVVVPSHRQRAVLRAKQRLTSQIWCLDFELEREVEAFAPGQFARLHVGNNQWRDYSIAGLHGRALRLLISTRTGGDGSHYVTEIQPGATTEVELPLGHFTLQRNDRRPVFIATGTGLAPFLPMFAALERDGRLGDTALVFGCRTARDDLTATQGPLPGQIVRCFSRDEPPAGGLRGRVTDAITTLDIDPDTTEVYLCGSSAMVVEAKALLEARGARHVQIENY